MKQWLEMGLAFPVNSIEINSLMKANTHTILFSLLMFWVSLLAGVYIVELDWKLVRKKNNIEVYSRMSSDEKLKEIKIRGSIKSTLSEVVLALEDVKAQKEWVLRTIDARTLDYTSDSDFIYYISTDMPFPIKDRDLVVHYTRTQDSNTKIVETKSRALPSFIPIKDSYIRIPFFDSSYRLIPKEGGWVIIEYVMKIDPGGALPLWLVNMAVSRGPLLSFESLFELIESDRYKGKSAKGVVELFPRS